MRHLVCGIAWDDGVYAMAYNRVLFRYLINSAMSGDRSCLLVNVVA